MSDKINHNNVVSYYDEHTKFKINDFVKVNPRVEEAWKTLIKNTPAKPKHILEVGCGVGSICARMSKKWPDAQITGIDISVQSIAAAQKLFANQKVNFIVSLLTEETFDEKFDLIVFMDVYEHIATTDRPFVHTALKKILNNKGKIFLSVPTPQNLKWSLIHKPETMQPVDEHISFDVINKLALDTDTEVQLYQVKSIWNTGDYSHVILEKNDDFESAFFTNKPINKSERAKRILNKIKNMLTQPLRRYLVFKKLG
jgi:2-polyprenyl-3-methyl-5-hydroxy-6-metoxy-1,4-benzoquinol methylase